MTDRASDSPDATASSAGEGSRSSPGSASSTRFHRWIAAHGFSLALLSVAVGLGLFLIIPMLQLFQSGYIFGADWSEYLYSGPTYFGGGHPLFQYPYPLLPVLYTPLADFAGHTSVTTVYLVEVISGLLVVAGFYVGYLACEAYTGSRWAGLLGGTVLAGFPLIQNEICWGGQSQMLAYILTLLAIWITVRRVLPDLTFVPALVVGSLLALAALSELYATFTLVLAFVLFIVPSLGRRVATVRSLRTLLAIFVPPAIAGGLLSLSIPASTNPAGGEKLWTVWRFGPMYHQLWFYLTLNNPCLEVAYGVGIGAYIVYRVVYRTSVPIQSWLVPAFAVATFVVGAFLTPAVNANRALYPLVFPIAFGVAELGAVWGKVVRTAPVALHWRFPPRAARAIATSLVLTSVLIAGLQLGADAQIYPNTLAQFSFDQTEASQLFFLEHEPGAILVDVSPIDHFFVDLWATGRPMYPGPAFEPYTVTNSAKQATVVLGTALSYGVNWIDDGAFVLTDAETSWGQPDPGIFFERYGHTFLSIEGNDFQNRVVYSSAGNPAQNYTTSLFSANSISTSASGAGLLTHYSFPGYTVDRLLSVAPNGTMSWVYSYAFSTATPHQASLVITDSTQIPTAGSLSVNRSSASSATLTQSFDATPLPTVEQSYTVRANVIGANLSTALVPHNQYGIFELGYDLEPATPTTRNFSVTLTVEPQGAGAVTPAVHTEAMTLASTGIQWVVLSRPSNPLILQRFFGDPVYELYETTSNFYILRVA